MVTLKIRRETNSVSVVKFQLGNQGLFYNLVLGNLKKSTNLKLLITNIMKKLNFLGIGPKIASVLLPYLILSIVLSTHFKLIFCYIPHKAPGLFYSGLAFLIVGLVFYSFTVRLLIKGLNETRLVTNGAFALCQNPLYSSIILFIIPALSMIINSWLVLTSSIIGYLLFKIFIKTEYKELEKFFGESYITYKEMTPEFFPFPLKKWF